MSKSRMMTAVAGAAMGLSAFAASAQNLDLNRAFDAELKADAQSRSSLAAAGQGTSGWDDGFYLADASGNNKLRIGGYFQARWTLNSGDDGVNGRNSPNSDLATGFTIPHFKINFSGNLFNKNTTFFVQGDFPGNQSEDNGVFVLNDAIGKYTWDNGVYFAMGQGKLPFSLEQLVADTGSESASRSIVDAIYSAGRAQGIWVGYESDQISVTGAFTDGARTQNTQYDSAAEADYAFTGRFEYASGQRPSDFRKRFQSWRSSTGNKWMAGGAVHFQGGGETFAQSASGTTTDTDIFALTADFSWRGAGWNLFFAGYWVDNDPATSTTNFDDYAGTGQFGYFFTDQFEGFVRWDGFFLDSARNLQEDSIQFATFGVNYFISPESDAAKVVADVQWALSDTRGLGSSQFAFAGFGLPDYDTGFLGNGQEEDEIVFRLQWQNKW